MAKAVLTFGLYQGDILVRREMVTQDIVKVGKDPKSHLRVDDELASRMHAVIEVAGLEDITLIDLGNEPGTQVNGARVNKCKLHVGDQIQVGGTKIVLESADPPGAEMGVAAAPAMAGARPQKRRGSRHQFAAVASPPAQWSACPQLRTRPRAHCVHMGLEERMAAPQRSGSRGRCRIRSARRWSGATSTLSSQRCALTSSPIRR